MHDPLINWRLLNTPDAALDTAAAAAAAAEVTQDLVAEVLPRLGEPCC